jgi:hypothetical protein
MGGDPGEVYAATAVLDHHQDVDVAQEDGVDVGEVDGEDRVGLRGQELSAGRPGPLWGGVDARRLQDSSDGGGGDPLAESDQLALDASVTPRRVLPGHPQYQRLDGLRRADDRVAAAERSSGARAGGRASAAGFSVTPAAAGATAGAAVCSTR